MNNMKAVLISVNKPHTSHMNCGKKLSELRTLPPNIKPPFKVYTYETKRNGGSGKVVNEWICSNMFEWLIYIGVPSHLSKGSCVSNEDIIKYSNNGKKPITEMIISNLKVYDVPRDLSEFYLCAKKGSKCAHWETVKRAPQNWCYVMERPVFDGRAAV